jgi:hypothetical protein
MEEHGNPRRGRSKMKKRRILRKSQLSFDLLYMLSAEGEYVSVDTKRMGKHIRCEFTRYCGDFKLVKHDYS